MKRVLLVFVAFVIVYSLDIEVRSEEEKSSALVHTRLTRELTYRDLVARGVDILAAYPDGRVDLAVTDKQLSWISSVAPMTVVLERAILCAPSDLDEHLGLYHTYAETEAMLDSLASLYPGLTHMDTLGTSIEGRLIRAIKISDNADTDEEEPEVLIMGCHHARELMSVEIPLLLAAYLLDNYGTSLEVTYLVDNREVWIAPMINPDGHVYVENNHSDPWWQWWRKNRRDNSDGTFGVDNNRNYGYMWGYDDFGSSPNTSYPTYRGTAPFSEPENQAVRDFCASRSFIVALSYHSYGEIIIYPWGYAQLYTDDHELFVTLADSLNRGLGYSSGNPAMGAIYVTNGGTNDWVYGDVSTKGRFFGYTIELNTHEEGGFAPPDTLIEATFEKVLDMNLTLIGRADNPHGVYGPQVPFMYDVTMLNPPNFKLHWSEGDLSDPNPPVSYEVVEFKNISGIQDSCEAGDTLWTLNGFTLTSTRSYAGGYSFYSGSGNNLNNTMAMVTTYPLALGETLSCWLWYDIETEYDYAYLEANFNRGFLWESVPGNITTRDDPNGKNRGNGITGSSGGNWVYAEFYLDSLGIFLEDATLLLRFSYITDDYWINEGMYVDFVYPVSSCEKMEILAAAWPDTFLHRWPDEVGDFAYYVRCVDNEGHNSRWSNVVFHTVDDLSPVPRPVVTTTLSRNYPNPFNPTTTIRFNIGENDLKAGGRARVLLELYDVSGRRVAVLKDDMMPSGVYSVRWDGTGQRGRILASGVYFARLSVGEKAFTTKMVLLR
ncbi:MAG: immune inhibitor A [bacterium]|nr:MAG: immune inhibitor A [bacterium]